jgi:hypothetical protein
VWIAIECRVRLRHLGPRTLSLARCRCNSRTWSLSTTRAAETPQRGSRTALEARSWRHPHRPERRDAAAGRAMRTGAGPDFGRLTLLGTLPDLISQRLSKLRVVKDPNRFGVKNARHARRVADPQPLPRPVVLTSNSSVKLRIVRIATIKASTPRFSKVGSMTTVPMMPAIASVRSVLDGSGLWGLSARLQNSFRPRGSQFQRGQRWPA